ncbi:MAG: P1 family peptidase [Anaerolineae bacterium]|nr:P1 family peptidase [Anaerolineae bacterium]
MAEKTSDTITDVPGIKVGHAQDFDAITGCTVVICEDGAVGGVDQRGGAPGTRETDLLRPMHLVERVHAVLLTGGSAFGLDAAAGVMAYLESRKIGFNAGVARVPIVPAAVLFDLDIGSSDIRPDAEMGRKACEAASADPVEQGSVGVGTGARVGFLFGPNYRMKGGIGSASIRLGGGIVVGALVAVNCYGDVVDPDTGQIVAGARKPTARYEFADTLATLHTFVGKTVDALAVSNTVIGVVATNAGLGKDQANKVAEMAHDGLARAVRPAHTMLDGDTIFALSTGKKKSSVNVIGAYAAEVVAQAIVNGVRAAASLGDCITAQDMITGNR